MNKAALSLVFLSACGGSTPPHDWTIVLSSTKEHIRNSEGDVAYWDGKLYSVFGQWNEDGNDQAPSRLVEAILDPRTGEILRQRPLFEGMDATLFEVNGKRYLAYIGYQPGMLARGMLLREMNQGMWGVPKPITPNTGNVHFANNGSAKVLSNGKVLIASREYLEFRSPYALIMENGEWHAGGYVPYPIDMTKEQMKVQNINEPNLEELCDGRILMTMRTVVGAQYFSYSSDQGETWGVPFRSPLEGIVAPAVLRRVGCRLYAIWNRGTVTRTNLTMAYSDDNGETWTIDRELEAGLSHYPTMMLVENDWFVSYSTYQGLEQSYVWRKLSR